MLQNNQHSWRFVAHITWPWTPHLAIRLELVKKAKQNVIPTNKKNFFKFFNLPCACLQTQTSSTLIEVREKQIKSQHVSTSLNFPALVFSLPPTPRAAAPTSMSLEKSFKLFRIIRSDSTRHGKIRLRHNRSEKFVHCPQWTAKPFIPCHEIFTSKFSAHEMKNVLRRSLPSAAGFVAKFNRHKRAFPCNWPLNIASYVCNMTRRDLSSAKFCVQFLLLPVTRVLIRENVPSLITL